PISFQEVIAGHLRVSLDMQQFQQPMTISLQSMGLLSLILLALALTLSMRLGRQLSTPLMQLRLWLRDPDDPAPGAGRQDEIGDLARQLQARLVPEKPEPEIDLGEMLDDGYFDQDDTSAFDETPGARPSAPTEPRFAEPALSRQTLRADDGLDDEFDPFAQDDPPLAAPYVPVVTPPATPAK